ncbi:MAG: hypothetical protein QG663_1489 [Thermodesulfobacteriota bacterium]|nr:hypothetical protein [Thermodesulfobacteriota bacterium]
MLNLTKIAKKETGFKLLSSPGPKSSGSPAHLVLVTDMDPRRGIRGEDPIFISVSFFRRPHHFQLGDLDFGHVRTTTRTF